jgi:cytochrome c oxidase subunit 2
MMPPLGKVAMKRSPRSFGMIALYAVMMLTVSAFSTTRQVGDSPRRIEVTAKRFEFTPNEVTVKKGESVVLAIRSMDVTHGLYVDQLHIKTDIPSGKVTEIPVTPTETGDFYGVCAHFCGAGHGTMVFTIHVVDN